MREMSHIEKIEMPAWRRGLGAGRRLGGGFAHQTVARFIQVVGHLHGQHAAGGDAAEQARQHAAPGDQPAADDAGEAEEHQADAQALPFDDEPEQQDRAGT